MVKPKVGDPIPRGTYAVRGIRVLNPKRVHVLSKYRRQPDKRKAAWKYVREWNDKGYGQAALRIVLARGMAVGKDACEIKARFLNLGKPKPTPPPRKDLRGRGWGDRIRQHYLEENDR